jgi:hypothetical protein
MAAITALQTALPGYNYLMHKWRNYCAKKYSARVKGLGSGELNDLGDDSQCGCDCHHAEPSTGEGNQTSVSLHQDARVLSFTQDKQIEVCSRQGRISRSEKSGPTSRLQDID